MNSAGKAIFYLSRGANAVRPSKNDPSPAICKDSVFFRTAYSGLPQIILPIKLRREANIYPRRGQIYNEVAHHRIGITH